MHVHVYIHSRYRTLGHKLCLDHLDADPTIYRTEGDTGMVKPEDYNDPEKMYDSDVLPRDHDPIRHVGFVIFKKRIQGTRTLYCFAELSANGDVCAGDCCVRRVRISVSGFHYICLFRNSTSMGPNISHATTK